MDPKTLPLRDIHLPEPVSWWPPAIGWWALLAISLVVIATALWWWRVRDRRPRPDVRRAALAHLATLRQDYARDADTGNLVREVSILLRRVSVSTYPRVEVAGLTGEAWLRLLDRGLDEPRFSQGPGRILEEAPYRRMVQADGQTVLELCETWIRTLPESPPQETKG